MECGLPVGATALCRVLVSSCVLQRGRWFVVLGSVLSIVGKLNYDFVFCILLYAPKTKTKK